MANKAKKSNKTTAKNAADSNVVRIRADSAAKSTDKPKKTTGKPAKAEITEVTKVKAAKEAKATQADKETKAVKPKKHLAKRAGKGFVGYFAGAWYELRQVRWPNRKATWSLTVAVLLYSAFFVLLILALDALFQKMFDLILGK